MGKNIIDLLNRKIVDLYSSGMEHEKMVNRLYKDYSMYFMSRDAAHNYISKFVCFLGSPGSFYSSEESFGNIWADSLATVLDRSLENSYDNTNTNIRQEETMTSSKEKSWKKGYIDGFFSSQDCESPEGEVLSNMNRRKAYLSTSYESYSEGFIEGWDDYISTFVSSPLGQDLTSEDFESVETQSDEIAHKVANHYKKSGSPKPPSPKFKKWISQIKSWVKKPEIRDVLEPKGFRQTLGGLLGPDISQELVFSADLPEIPDDNFMKVFESSRIVAHPGEIYNNFRNNNPILSSDPVSDYKDYLDNFGVYPPDKITPIF